MQPIAASELILNQRNALYHLDTKPNEIAQHIILVGDPARVAEVSKHFDSITYQNKHREFITHTGILNHKPISVVSTGIGPDNIDIVLNELDALVNIDLHTRTIKPTLTSLYLYRIGTSGSLQPDIAVDSFVANSFGLGLDNLLHFYGATNTAAETELLQAFVHHAGIDKITKPYLSAASAELMALFKPHFHTGITATCPGFYGPQGRQLRLKPAFHRLPETLTHFMFNDLRITNFEMETSAIYGLGKLLGHHCISLNAIVANRTNKTFSKNPQQTVENLIVKTLSIITNEL